MVRAIGADGIFLDTMVQAPTRLRQAVDVAHRGVAFEPEGHPSVTEMEVCSGSWAQWLQAYPDIGVLLLKWLEPRHMQHQIRRWDRGHREELAAAWLNGSGVMVWENVFGSWNPWPAGDRALLRRMAPVLRHFAGLFTDGEWLPCFPTAAKGVVAGCWQDERHRLWTLVNRTGAPVEGIVLEVEDRGERYFDLWRGVELQPERIAGKAGIRLRLEDFGAVLALRGSPDAPLRRLLARQRDAAARPAPSDAHDTHATALPVLEPRPAPSCPPAPVTEGMLPVAAGERDFVLRHMRRECGCYPDPGTPPGEWKRFLTGTPFDGTIEHRVRAAIQPCRIDPDVVTNAQFERFLKTSGYRPRHRERFLAHWSGAACPAELRDQPVVYVDLEDARAYAAWAGRRLPSEWEWQAAAEEHGERFRRGRVWEWTESERDDGHTRFVMLRGGSRYQAPGSVWYFPGGPQPIQTHAKFLRMWPGLDRCSTIGFRCVAVPR